jgi:putative nucleotidyltransferase with HDIG domain
LIEFVRPVTNARKKAFAWHDFSSSADKAFWGYFRHIKKFIGELSPSTRSMANSVYEKLPSIPIRPIFRPIRILIADGEAGVREVLVRRLTSLGYECESCEDGRVALELLNGKTFDLLLADSSMPKIGDAALHRAALRLQPHLAVILLTRFADIGTAVDSLKDGIYDYIIKPSSPEEVSLSIARALEKRRLLLENQNYQHTLEEQVAKRTQELEKALGVLEHTYDSTLVALSKALDSRDADFDGHSLRVTAYTTRLAQQLSLCEADIRVIQQGVLLHDIGKIGIPDELLRKPGELNENEWALMRKHPEIGYRILTRIEFLKEAAQLVLHHHERYDGKGYPLHLKGEDINLGARIFAVADTLDGITSKRPFQAPVSLETACGKIEKLSGNQLDPKVVNAFLGIPVPEWKAIRRAFATDAASIDFLRHGSEWKMPDRYRSRNSSDKNKHE